MDFGSKAVDCADSGTTKQHRLEENLGAASVELTPDDLRQLNEAASRIELRGARYSEGAQRMIDR